MMRVIIPTYRRSQAQATLEALPSPWQQRTVLVADAYDAPRLKHRYNHLGMYVLEHPPEITSIAKKRAWILQNSPEEKIVMLDDDLRFAARGQVEDTRLHQATLEEIDAGLRELEQKLKTYVHAGFSARQGNNHQPSGWVENTRMMYVLGYRVEDVLAHCSLGRIEHREDMELSLQLLRQGYPNAVYTNLCVDQRYNNPGGCSEQRTVEKSNADADLLAELHPGFVIVKEKAYVNSIPRKEVIVQWKKAFGASL